MAEETKNDNFEELFDSNEFDFLEENEINTENNASTENNPHRGKLPVKSFIITGGILLVGIFLFKAIQPKKSPQAVETVTKSAPNVASLNDVSTTSTPAANVTVTNQNNNPLTVETTKAISPQIEQKSNEEDLFATNNIETTNNLETAVAQETKEAITTTQNMDLYFGSNIPRTKTGRTITKETEEKDNSKSTLQLQHIVESITQEITDNVNQTKQLEDKINDLSKLLTKVNQNVGAIDSRMLGLTESVDSLMQDVSNVKKVISEEDLDLTLNTNKPATEAQLTYKSPGYSIHAIIPGRAWLKSSSGQIITAAEGDTVGDYGTVAVIDAANNIVRTSSGVTFR